MADLIEQTDKCAIPASCPMSTYFPLSLSARLQVTTIGFPAGVDRLLAIFPKVGEQLAERYGDAGPLVLNQLARRNLIKPLISQGHVMDSYDDRIVYDAASGDGSSGSPVFGPSGYVIGIQFGFLQPGRLANYAVPVGRCLPLLGQAGWQIRHWEGAVD